MKITRYNPMTRKHKALDVPCTQAQLDAWENGMLIQKAMPNVPAELREFLITGFTPQDWKEAFGDPAEWEMQ